jgi:arsenate reductase
LTLVLAIGVDSDARIATASGRRGSRRFSAFGDCAASETKRPRRDPRFPRASDRYVSGRSDSDAGVRLCYRFATKLVQHFAGRHRDGDEQLRWNEEPHAVTIRVYQYPKCSTCRKALAWLEARGLTVEKHDLVAEPISLAKLTELLRRSGLPLTRFFNVSGESYRAGGFKDRVPSMTEHEKLVALSKNGKLVKRPIVDVTGKDGDAVLVGFDEKAYAAQFR